MSASKNPHKSGYILPPSLTGTKSDYYYYIVETNI